MRCAPWATRSQRSCTPYRSWRCRTRSHEWRLAGDWLIDAYLTGEFGSHTIIAPSGPVRRQAATSVAQIGILYLRHLESQNRNPDRHQSIGEDAQPAEWNEPSLSDQGHEH